jgi:hypothetical protein
MRFAVSSQFKSRSRFHHTSHDVVVIVQELRNYRYLLQPKTSYCRITLSIGFGSERSSSAQNNTRSAHRYCMLVVVECSSSKYAIGARWCTARRVGRRLDTQKTRGSIPCACMITRIDSSTPSYTNTSRRLRTTSPRPKRRHRILCSQRTRN